MPLAIFHFTGNATFHIIGKYVLYYGLLQNEKVLISSDPQAAAGTAGCVSLTAPSKFMSFPSVVPSPATVT